MLACEDKPEQAQQQGGQEQQPSIEARQAVLGFQPIQLSTEDRVIVPPGYSVQTVVRCGDPLKKDVPGLDLSGQTAERQGNQFGYNCDFVAYFPLNNQADRGLLAVNHEYSQGELMFAGYDPQNPTREQVDIELAAHGIAIVEVQHQNNRGWHYLSDSRYNRRVTGETEIEITGPVAGHDWMKTPYDSAGTRVRGSLNNCAGGKTPWGTYLSCEENFNQYWTQEQA